MDMLSRKHLRSAELETFQIFGNLTTILTAIEVQTHEEATVYVHDLELFVKVQILEDMPAVLSSGELCEEHGCSYEWANGQKPQLTKNGKIIVCNTANFVPVVSGLSTVSSSSSASSSSTSSPKDSSGISPSPAIQRSDDTHAQSSRNQGDPTKTKNNNNSQASNVGDLPDWLEEFTENLKDAESASAKYFS